MAKLRNPFDILLQVEAKSRNHGWNIIPFVFLILECFVEKRVFGSLRFAFLYKFLLTFPFVHHYLYIFKLFY